MELFVSDNHAVNSAELFPVSDRISLSLQHLVKVAYPSLFKDNEAFTVSSIGSVNINSSNFCINETYYLKLIASDKPNTPVSLFPSYARHLRSFNCIAPDYFPIQGNTLTEGIGISSPILLETIGHPKSYYFFLQEFVSVRFFSGSSSESEKAIRLISAMESIFRSENGWNQPLLDAHLAPYNAYHPKEAWSNLRQRFIADSHHDSIHFRSVEHTLPGILDAAIESIQHDFSQQFQASSFQLVHIDLHPHNILVNSDGNLVVIDYESFRYMPVVVYRGFSLFKLLRKSVSSGELSLLQARNLVQQTFSKDDRKEALAGAKGELIRRILVVLDLHYNHHDTRWDFDLVKHTRGILEATALLGNDE